MPKSSSTRGQKMVGIDTTLVRPKVQPPEDMSLPAKEVWRKLIDSTPNEQFTNSDFPILVTYCETYATMRKALDMMQWEGEILVDRYDKPYKNPWYSIAIETSAKIPNLAVKLRLNPSSRQKGEVTKEKAPASKPTTTLGNLIKR
jgi:P27 family predicted phage terminase small subunit